VPGWLSVWGFSALRYGSPPALVVYGLDPSSANVLAAPIGLQEMAGAVWLIVRAFTASARACEPEEEPAADD
jgi:hypothetical protein